MASFGHVLTQGPSGRQAIIIPCRWAQLRKAYLHYWPPPCPFDILYPEWKSSTMAAPETDTPIRVDEALDDADSSYGGESDVTSETTSLYSAITKYVYENGRRYHSYRYGTYW